MDAWSNISLSSRDPEISRINDFEESLGTIPEKVSQIRALITRYEVCHFKYRKHIRIIKESIVKLDPLVVPERIGITHIRHGEEARRNDITGKSLLGQQYLWAIRNWLGILQPARVPDEYDKMLGQKVHNWLGNKNDDKKRLVRLLIARLTWDWKSYELLQHGGESKELEFQICRMDICHYAFPDCLDRVIRGIGEMRPFNDFEGCGTFSDEIRKAVRYHLVSLNNLFNRFQKSSGSDPESRIKAWLVACFMKTLKQQVEISDPPIEFYI